jgi:hypothetical protein
MVKIIVSTLLVSLLLGCSTTGGLVRVETQTVDIPVVIPQPVIEVPPRPTLELTTLAPDTPPEVVVRAYQITILQLQTYANQLEVLLGGVNASRVAPK